MRRLSVVFTLFAVVGLAARDTAACSLCRCGDPVFSLVGSQIFVPRTLHLGLDEERYAKDQVAENDPSLREREVENRITLSGTYTIGRRVTLVARLPFSSRSITAGGESASLTGLSDPELAAHFRLVSPDRGSWLSAGLGLRTGWGQNERIRDGARAEEHLQPGTGSAGLDPGLAFAHVLGEGNASVYGSVAGRLNGRNAAGYHYGHALLANLGYERRLAGRVNALLELNYRTAGKDEPAMGETDPNTGGTMVYVTPRILLRLERSLFLRVGVQIPVVKSLNGDQDEKVNLLSGLTVRF